MKIIEVNSYEELVATQKEVISRGFKFNTRCGAQKIMVYKRGDDEIRIRCNFWK